MKPDADILCPLCQEKACHWGDIAGSAYYRCSLCTVVFLWPIPSERALREYYEGTFAVIACRRQRSEKELLRLLSSYSPGKEMLDVGAGWGDLVAEAESIGFTGEAVEIREECVDALKMKGFHVFRGNFQDFHAQKRYHCVTMLHTLEHMSDPAAAVRKVSSILAEGGVCALTVPNADSIAYGIWRQYSEWFQPGGHLFHFSPASLRMLLERENFEIVEQRTRRSFAPTFFGHTLFYVPVVLLKRSGLYYSVRRKVGESPGSIKSRSRRKPPPALLLLHGYLELTHLLSLPLHYLTLPLWRRYEKKLMGDELLVVARKRPSS
ncbi:MAG: class I SAM-dependent methyltransferase [Candidatus Xenobiia bacterium LiM19]